MEVGYGYGSLTELTEVPGRYANVVPVPRVLWHGRTELTKVSGTCMNVVQNSARVTGTYGFGSTELTEVPVIYCVEDRTHRRSG